MPGLFLRQVDTKHVNALVMYPHVALCACCTTRLLTYCGPKIRKILSP